VTILYGGLRNSLSSGNTDGTNKYNHCINQEATWGLAMSHICYIQYIKLFTS